MRKVNIILTAVLSVLFAASLFVFASCGKQKESKPTADKYFIFSLLDNDTYSIAAKDVENLPADVVIPSERNGKPVTAIGEYAFYNCGAIKSITIPAGVNFIGEKAFRNCKGLTSVKIPNSVIAIGENAFSDCVGLESVTFTANSRLTSIGDGAFTGCPIEKATIPTVAIDYIPKNKLKYVEIDGGYAIPNYAFYDCSSLTSITIGNGVTSIGKSAFAYCNGLTSVTIGNGVTSIDDWAFYNCDNLTSVTIGSGVTSIGEKAFYRCSNLTSIEIPDRVTSIGKSAFEDCSSLTDISIPFVGQSKDGTDNTYFSYIFGASGYRGSSYVPESLKTVIITGESSIDDWAFYYCSNLTSVTIGDGVTSIGERAFYYCSNLTSITIPDSVTSIGESAFAYCSGLTSVTIPDSVTSIGDGAFRDCSSLTSITVDGKNQYYKSIDGNLYSKDGETLIQYATGKNDASFSIPSGVTNIGDSAFSGCSGLTSITIPSGVTSIGIYAFYDCGSLTSVTIGNGVTSIGESAFEFCSSLTSITIPNSVTSIRNFAFYNCDNLTSVTIGSGVTSIGYWAFEGCDSLTSIIVDGKNQHYKSIDGNLYSKDGKTLIQYAIGKTNAFFPIPSGVTSIYYGAFYDCGSLTSVTIGNGVTSIGDGAFAYCNNLTNITFTGTKAQWNGITKDYSWNFGVPATVVHCTDGDVII